MDNKKLLVILVVLFIVGSGFLYFRSGSNFINLKGKLEGLESKNDSPNQSDEPEEAKQDNKKSNKSVKVNTEEPEEEILETRDTSDRIDCNNPDKYLVQENGYTMHSFAFLAKCGKTTR